MWSNEVWSTIQLRWQAAEHSPREATVSKLSRSCYYPLISKPRQSKEEGNQTVIKEVNLEVARLRNRQRCGSLQNQGAYIKADHSTEPTHHVESVSFGLKQHRPTSNWINSDQL